MAELNQDHKRSRLGFVDGMRGVAIIVVILYHAFARWPEFYGYGNRFVGNPFLDTKIAGVRLFFIISGFVILMTLERCRGFWDFMIRRWLRLFPAMLICSVVIYATAWLIPERPRGMIRLYDLIPGLTFTGDSYDDHMIWGNLGHFLGVYPKSIEGAFWSLYVEVRFYIVFGLVFYFWGRLQAIASLMMLYLCAVLSSDKIMLLHGGPNNLIGRTFHFIHDLLFRVHLHDLCALLRSQEYGWFAAGALFFIFHKSRDSRFFWAGSVIALISVLGIADTRAVTLILTLLFIASMRSELVQHILSTRVLVFIGFISYPLYLLHENMMVGLIVKIGRAIPHLPALITPVFPVAVVIGLAWFVAKFAEPAVRTYLETLLRPFLKPTKTVPLAAAPGGGPSTPVSNSFPRAEALAGDRAE